MAKKKAIPHRVSTARPKARSSPDDLLNDLRQIIVGVRGTVAQSVNSALVQLYWHIGQRIRSDILQNQRADYGAEILQTLSAKLVTEFGRGYSERNLANMVRFAEVFSDQNILQTLSAKLG